MELSTSYKNGKVLSGAAAVIERFEIACLMSLGEFSPAPSEGIGIGDYVDEPNSQATLEQIQTQIVRLLRRKFPELRLIELTLDGSQGNTVSISARLFVLSEGKEQTSEFEFNGIA